LPSGSAARSIRIESSFILSDLSFIGCPPLPPILSLFTGSVLLELHYTQFPVSGSSVMFLLKGRWNSPDPAGLAVADPTDPQSWNRYAYVNNNPLANFDPLGMGVCTIPSQANSVGGSGQQCPGDSNYNPSNITGPGTDDLPGGHTGGPASAMGSNDMQAGYDAYVAQVNAVFAQGLINKFGAQAFQGNTAWSATIDVPGGCTSYSVGDGPTSTPVCDEATTITRQQLTNLIAQTSVELKYGELTGWSWSATSDTLNQNGLVVLNRLGFGEQMISGCEWGALALGPGLFGATAPAMVIGPVEFGGAPLGMYNNGAGYIGNIIGFGLLAGGC
jgi:hypothetical protein